MSRDPAKKTLETAPANDTRHPFAAPWHHVDAAWSLLKVERELARLQSRLQTKRRRSAIGELAEAIAATVRRVRSGL